MEREMKRKLKGFKKFIREIETISGLGLGQRRSAKQIRENVPSIIQPVFLSYAGVQGTSVYNSFIKKKLIYKSATFRKPN